MNVLLSIKPKFVEKIMKGNKKYEFRKSVFKYRNNLEKIYIYSTSPVKKIVGTFRLGGIIKDHPENLWKNFREFSGIDEEEFFNYFGTRNIGFAIKIEKIEIFKKPIDPKIFIPNFLPPQSFYYINKYWKVA